MPKGLAMSATARSAASTSAESLLSPTLLAKLERLELVSRKIFRGRLKGERRSRRKGQSVEFADFRNYVPGDDLRFVDWNLYARLDKLFLKLFMEEEDLHFYTLIDASTSMGFGEPSKLHYAKQLAAALGFIGLCRADRVKIHILGSSRTKPAPVLRGRHSLWRMQEHLEDVEAEYNTPLAAGVKEFCLRNTGKGIVVLISDLMDKTGYQAALQMLLAQQMDVYVIHLLCPEELDPEIAGDLKLVDSEDGDIAEITVSRPLLDRYKQTLAAFINGARDYCSRRGLVYLLANTETPVETLVANYLRRRGLVR
jgi:uncharacterized protein (DUF58 family)